MKDEAKKQVNKTGDAKPRPRRKQEKWMEKATAQKSAHSITSKKASKPVARTLLKVGAVIRARVEFDDEDKYKPRPCVVLSTTKTTIQVVPIFSQKKNTAERLKISDPEVAGLIKASYFKVRIESIDLRDAIELLGMLSQQDQECLASLLKEHSKQDE